MMTKNGVVETHIVSSNKNKLKGYTLLCVVLDSIWLTEKLTLFDI
jgi:hypothetical protein